MSSTSLVAERLSQVQARIRKAAQSCDRDPNSITLVAVSKTRPADDLRAAFAAGQTVFGENYVQEALAKMDELAALPIEWHYIGRIQSNKTRDLATRFHWIHALASLKHARRLSDQRPEGMRPLQVCIQVNLSGEASKGGVTPDELPELALAVAELPRLRLRGLMTMPPAAADETRLREIFGGLARLREALASRGLALDQLSMGMSGDMETAICEGATMVRIGTAIFGPRS